MVLNSLAVLSQRKISHPILTNIHRTWGALLGIVYVKAEGDYLYFAASVGSPDVTSDEYVPLVLKISRMGSISISKDEKLDTNASAEDEEDEEDGV